jgi:hypothetical protein
MAISAKHTNVLKSTKIKLLNVWLVKMFLILVLYGNVFTHFNERFRKFDVKYYCTMYSLNVCYLPLKAFRI